MRNVRSRKQHKIDWISCNKRGQWVHPQFPEISKKEITKINNCIKNNEAEPFFKRLKCSIVSAKAFGIDILQFIKHPTKSVSCQSQTKTISHTAQQMINQIKFIHHQTKYQCHQKSKTQISHYHRELTSVTQKTHLSPEQSSYQTQTVCQ